MLGCVVFYPTVPGSHSGFSGAVIRCLASCVVFRLTVPGSQSGLCGDNMLGCFVFFSLAAQRSSSRFSGDKMLGCMVILYCCLSSRCAIVLSVHVQTVCTRPSFRAWIRGYCQVSSEVCYSFVTVPAWAVQYAGFMPVLQSFLSLFWGSLMLACFVVFPLSCSLWVLWWQDDSGYFVIFPPSVVGSHSRFSDDRMFGCSIVVLPLTVLRSHFGFSGDELFCSLFSWGLTLASYILSLPSCCSWLSPLLPLDSLSSLSCYLH